MNYVKHLSMSLLLLAIPAALLADGDTSSASTSSTATDTTYWETVKAFPGLNPKSTIGLGLAVTAAAVYAAHTYHVGFRENVSGPALEKVKAYGKNLSDGETNTLIGTGVAVVVLGGGFYAAHSKWNLLDKLQLRSATATPETPEDATPRTPEVTTEGTTEVITEGTTEVITEGTPS